VNGQDIAVKCVRRLKNPINNLVNREALKGKFTELLENEIKVLRTCSNENIIKLVDLKKTANNIYLILEYCNEGDLACK
jgi:serine/threonine-protein kinase ULK/ATG1